MKNYLLILFFFTYGGIFAQNQDWETKFFYQVKNIDDFIGRFNADSDHAVVKSFAELYPEEKGYRSRILISLFDLRKPDLDSTLIRTFVDVITKGGESRELSVYDNDWYAQLQCRVKYKGNIEDMTIAMQLEKTEDYSSKWVIRGVHGDFLKTPISASDNRSFHPASDGVDFMNLRNLFKADKSQIRSYLYKDYKLSALDLFVHELLAGNVEFDQLSDISYHFLQLDGWAFVVDKQSREDLNSGWLIRDLIRITDKQKDIYKKEILYLDE